MSESMIEGMMYRRNVALAGKDSFHLNRPDERYHDFQRRKRQEKGAFKKAASGRYADGRREHMQRKHILLHKAAFACMTILFVVIFALSVFSLSAKADSTAHANEYKYYTSHQIEPGESLWSIAKEALDTMDGEHYNSVKEYIDEIKEVNQMSGDQIQSGNYVLLPYFSE